VEKGYTEEQVKNAEYEVTAATREIQYALIDEAKQEAAKEALVRKVAEETIREDKSKKIDLDRLSAEDKLYK
jgi:hypothetical protein